MTSSSYYPFWKRNLYTVTLAMVTVNMGFSFVFPFMPLFLQQIGIPDHQQAAFWTGLFSTTAGLTMATFSPIWGVMSDRFGRKLLVLRAMFGGAIAIGAMSLASSPVHVFGLRLLHGAMSGILAPSSALVAAYTPRARMGYAMGMVQMGMATGTAFGPVLGGLAADAFGFRPTFALAGGLVGISGLVVLLVVVEKFQAPEPTARAAAPSPWRSLWQSATSRQMAPILLAVFFVNLVPMIANPVLPVYIGSIQNREQVASLSGLAFSIIGTLGAVSAVVCGKLSERIGLKPILVAACLIGGLVVIPQSLVRTIPELFVLIGLQGICNGGMMTAVSAMVARSAARGTQGATFGAAGMATSLAFSVGPISGGTVAAMVGLPAVFVVSGLVYLLMGVGAVKIIAAGSEPREPRIRGEVPEA